MRVLIFFLGIAAMVLIPACSESKVSDDEAVKKIVAELLNNCKSGDYDATFKQLSKLRKKDEKEFSYELDKNFIQGKCKKYNDKFGGGYDFVNFQNKDGYLEWEVFPRNGKESSQIFSFVVEDREYKYSSDYALKK